ncbi:serine hydrolase domain-containing protein [Blastomonas marina]|uniref:serine hydrolase domain-containing protein n=1 Tax=Blastomonas marina TaxID=1867408 RepID=UPI002AC9754E|nr:serine hydrolase domain-containing protein [Blastomonas marina]WPZ04600.1 serine hydrolase domain-containing protein [Blastomonas marina]
MRELILSLGALALASCAPLADLDSGTNDARPAVIQVTPATSVSQDDGGPLFWDDATRAKRFRAMEAYFAGQEVAAAANPRMLARGEPFDAATRGALDAYLGTNGTAGIMVLQDGQVRYENYALGMTPTDRWTSFSVAKSFTSTLLGAAIADGAIASVDDPVTRYVPGLADTAYDGVTVGQVATMTSGVAWDENYSDPESDVAQMLAIAPVAGESQAVTYARTLSREAPAGEKWVYKTLETNLLGLIVEEAVDMSLAEYANLKLVEPAGFAGKLFWMQDLTGGSIGGCCLSLRLSDYARFGQFVLEGGEGVVPAGWFDESVTPTSEFGGGFGYGYQWWTYPVGYGAQGIFGQSITILPEQEMVIAIVSNWPKATGREFSQARLALAAQLVAAGAR